MTNVPITVEPSCAYTGILRAGSCSCPWALVGQRPDLFQRQLGTIEITCAYVTGLSVGRIGLDQIRHLRITHRAEAGPYVWPFAFTWYARCAVDSSVDEPMPGDVDGRLAAPLMPSPTVSPPPGAPPATAAIAQTFRFIAKSYSSTLRPEADGKHDTRSARHSDDRGHRQWAMATAARMARGSSTSASIASARSAREIVRARDS